VRALALERREEAAQRRPADERARDGREAPARGLPRAVRVDELRPDDAGARVLLEEGGERGDGARLRDRVRVVDEDQVAARLGDAAVQVRGVRQGPRVLDSVDARREAAGQVPDQDDLVDLGLERRERLGELGAVAVGDDDRGDQRSAFR
jgi:hypothetical protein